MALTEAQLRNKRSRKKAARKARRSRHRPHKLRLSLFQERRANRGWRHLNGILGRPKLDPHTGEPIPSFKMWHGPLLKQRRQEEHAIGVARKAKAEAE